MLALLSRRPVDRITEARRLARRHPAAAAMLAESAVRLALADLVVRRRPDLKRFYSGKRLAGFLTTERIIDHRLAAEIRSLSLRAFDAAYRGGVAVDRVLVDAASLRDRLAFL